MFSNKKNRLSSSLKLKRKLIKKELKILLKKIKPYKKLPWILLFGEKSSGKSTLLTERQQSLDIIRISLSNNEDINYIDCWVSKKVIFFEANTKLLTSEKNNFNVCLLWGYLLQQLQKKRNQKDTLFDQVLLIFSSTLLQLEDSEREAILTTIKPAWNDVLNYAQCTPITLIMTQSDRIDGFLDFFNDLSKEEGNQTVGIAINPSHHLTEMEEQVATHLNSLAIQVEKQLFWRLHHEPSLQNRQSLINFPLSLKVINYKIILMIDSFFKDLSIKNYGLNGIYFTSCPQTNKQSNQGPSNLDSNQLSGHFNSQYLYNHEFFIQNLFQNQITNIHRRINLQKKINHRRIIYYTIISLLAASYLYLYYSQKENQTFIREMEIAIQAPLDTTQPLAKLNLVYNALDKTSLTQNISRFWFQQTKTFTRELQLTYKLLIKKDFVYYLENMFKQDIQLKLNQQPAALYSTLQVYLMLKKPNSKHDHQIILRWFKNKWGLAYGNDSPTTKTLIHYLNTLLTLKEVVWPEDAALIKKAQHYLQSIPIPQLALSTLKYQYRNEKLIMQTQHPFIQTPSPFHTTIPQYYNPIHFTTFYQIEIPKQAKAFIDHQWILGQTDSTATIQNPEELSMQMQKLALAGFYGTWEKLLAQLLLKPANNFESINKYITMLKQEDSSLWKTIKNMINKPILKDHFENLLSFNNLNSQHYQSLITLLDNIQHYITPMHNTPTAIKVAYDRSNYRFNKLNIDDSINMLRKTAETYPAPLNQWLTTLADNIWEVMLNQAYQYINVIWASSVMPEYKNIKSYKPNDDKKINLELLNSFISPSGTLHSFFDYYLKPFVKEQDGKYSLIKIQNNSIPIKQESLDLLFDWLQIKNDTENKVNSTTLSQLKLPNTL